MLEPQVNKWSDVPLFIIAAEWSFAEATSFISILGLFIYELLVFLFIFFSNEKVEEKIIAINPKKYIINKSFEKILLQYLNYITIKLC